MINSKFSKEKVVDDRLCFLYSSQRNWVKFLTGDKEFEKLEGVEFVR
jgi:hypothetical protein